VKIGKNRKIEEVARGVDNGRTREKKGKNMQQ